MVSTGASRTGSSPPHHRLVCNNYQSSRCNHSLIRSQQFRALPNRLIAIRDRLLAFSPSRTARTCRCSSNTPLIERLKSYFLAEENTADSHSDCLQCYPSIRTVNRTAVYLILVVASEPSLSSTESSTQRIQYIRFNPANRSPVTYIADLQAIDLRRFFQTGGLSFEIVLE